MHTASRVYAMLGNETLWDAALASHAVLGAAGLPHAVLGGVAVCLHGYRRNTVDVDLLVRSGDADAIRGALTYAGWRWDADQKEFDSPAGIVLQFLLAGDKAGAGSEVRLPDPADEESVTQIEGLPVLTLARLIESKLACGQGNARRMHKDFADVVELIAMHKLPRSFARKLHASLRPAFLELLDRVRS
ncbi:hypothetical protein Pla175_23740 [Pirellulimonas nuda]|uniref:Nucleotidyltransferase family protein n=1 Tax=Pirellulimonas nuda TaxID=2528009 RepID=A0A518DC03_9BACT|nr:hypothetical protein [Pirellulimonas nuda]QDU88990.1 hypothetical protein Pla175_23740 [Pirellulimonas nuda]